MNNPNIEANKGDILWSNNNLNKSGRTAHYMVFMKPYDKHYFVGAMITHSKKFDNLPLEESYLKKTDSFGKGHKVVYDNSLVVSQPLFKKLDWQPFEKVGELTAEGIAFIEKHILGSAPGFYYDNV
ncbi:hypothetical protein [Pedobacter hartonius]|uniref:PemK-like, MazF-like toxin of type II toxin-antitoxin system n=1 Tax=Pedobacter hartonius TaxID=425514 RepID=A0A1H4HMK0_9SPHI|nr:hypothetical protein [Pedobacter hartonius]SEB22282.1 hypothetical protein SAMN05443550_1316 [Pedobacter hartonius]